MGWLSFACLLSVLAVVLYAVVRFVQLLRSDCDLTCAAALSKVPGKGAYSEKVVWVVGASSGIGQEIAIEYARQGAHVILSARRVERLEKVAARCELVGGTAQCVPLDVTKLETHKGIVQGILAEHQAIDILVNNAGRSQRAVVEEAAIDVDVQLFHTNVFGIMSITKAVLPSMISNGGGKILVTSSVAGKVGSPCSSTYSATKHALHGFFNTLRNEMGNRNIQVTVACPGPVRTECQSASATADGTALGAVKDDATKRMTAQRVALLMIAALHCNLDEVWMAPQPILLFTYIAQYLPTLALRLGKVIGPKRVASFKGGDPGYTSIQSPFAVVKTLFGFKG